MTGYKLYYSPGSCARVTAIALEECHLDFVVELVRLGQGQHKTPEFLAINRKAKVPALSIDGCILTENPAILRHLHEQNPSCRLLPAAADAIERSNQLADLCFCSATLHPIVTRICIPAFFGEGESTQASIKDLAIEMMKGNFAIIEERLAAGLWWYGDDWSIIDGYLFWIWSRVHGCGFPTGDFPRFADHATRIQDRPSIQRAIRREQEALNQLRTEGLAVMPAPPLT